MKNYPLLLAILFVLVFILSGIAPASQSVWVAEIIPVAITFALLVWRYKYFRFSNWAYSLMFFWLLCHSIGAHYTFANVPFEWFRELVGAQRNPFDRIAHFTIGFYAFPAAEWLTRKHYARPIIAGIFAIFFLMAVAASYEMIEWQYAVIVGGEDANDFLGSQGDIWDAQKDMFCDTCGALSSIILFFIVRPWRSIKKLN
ncbi:MAG: DUF2238 domain-containing protein [Akkermansia sp.]